MKIEKISLEKLIPYARNAKLHSDAQVAQIAGSIKEFGFVNPVLIDDAGVIIAGHGRVLAARNLALKSVPCIRLNHLTEAQRKAYRIADNKLAEIGGGWDEELLKIELGELASRFGFEISVTGFTSAEIDELNNIATPDDFLKGALFDRFIYPPFTVLDARSGWWVDRKRRWLDAGIDSGEGRSDELVFSESSKASLARIHGDKNLTGTSIFDPVLCELIYRWFVPPAGTVLDPFAGGSVRGIVAASIGLRYTGIDLREEQVAANREQATKFDFEISPTWFAGDSAVVLGDFSDGEADFIFSCPPYADLEVYSDDPRDISTFDYADFLPAYRDIIAKSARLLKPNRFACFVVGDVRDKKTGFYRNFVSATIDAFESAGLHLYNEAVLVTVACSLPLRISRQFQASRKLGKTHQNVLVFCKGDPAEAVKACGEIVVSTPLDDAENTAPEISHEKPN